MKEEEKKTIGKTLEEHIDFWHKAYNDTFDELQREKERNKTLQKIINEEYEEDMVCMNTKYLKYNYVSKDEIREIINKTRMDLTEGYNDWKYDENVYKAERQMLLLLEKRLLKEN